MDIDQPYKRFIENLKGNDIVLAVILVGSFAKGRATAASDIDTYLIVNNGTSQKQIEDLKTMIAAITKGRVDLSTNGIQTLQDFKDYAVIGTEFAWDRYNLVHNVVEIDKSDGEIKSILQQKATLSDTEVAVILERYLGQFINITYRSVVSALGGDQTAARLDAAEAVEPLLNCLFAFKHRVTPFNKYLAWELKNKPLGYDFDSQLLPKLLAFCGGDIASQRLFFEAIKVESFKADKRALYKTWGKKLDIMYAPSA